MASIFTYDPDPPRVASPWSRGPTGTQKIEPIGRRSPRSFLKDISSSEFESPLFTITDRLSDIQLDAEPQDGPTEYKLHLLLRPRRSFLWTTTGKNITGSQHSKSPTSTSQDRSEVNVSMPNATSQSNVTRQHRFEQLTTQLLWRLQQSSPFHTSSSVNLILPTLPEATPELELPQTLAKLVPGLEESKGALYEIGVADDGSLVGLTKDEMDESINNLRAMAASLGCSVEILRTVAVGECAWSEDWEHDPVKSPASKHGPLFVAEAFVKPELPFLDLSPTGSRHSPNVRMHRASSHDKAPRMYETDYAQDQIRVTLTGATFSGKSSLLGTLSTSTLDDGRGKSRLNSLRHGHERATGMTSSVAQELIGYYETSNKHNETHVVNHASENVSTWNDIHSSSKTGRLAFISDSAGHPRYRRTTVRGLVGGAPHWTMLCISATDGTETLLPGLHRGNDSDASQFAGASAHLSMAHLDLCLRLNLQLVIVVTKFDLASKQTFRSILSSLLSTIKGAMRKPIIIASQDGVESEQDLQTIPESNHVQIESVLSEINEDPQRTVPIIFTSAVKGTGISKLHSLLRHLPIPQELTSDDSNYHLFLSEERPSCVFHIDDTFELTKAKAESDISSSDPAPGIILSGHLATGRIHVGQGLVLGPFPSDTEPIDALRKESTLTPLSQHDDPFLTPRSFSDAVAMAAASYSRNRGIKREEEWRRVKVVSVRNLRLPVRILETDRVGTIAISFTGKSQTNGPVIIRRGMVLLDQGAKSIHTFTAAFEIADASSAVVGTRVVLYSASVRAAAKVIAIALRDDDDDPTLDLSRFQDDFSDDFAFELDDQEKKPLGQQGDKKPSHRESILVTFQLSTCKEWLTIGAKVLVMPGGGPGLYARSERGMKGVGGLEGYVGKIVETFT